jgi:sugar lactone lactonase YvrE
MNSVNPLKGWKLDASSISTLGKDLVRPECILAQRTGDLWVADGRGGVTWIKPDGSQTLIAPEAPESEGMSLAQRYVQSNTMPNGIALDKNGDIIIANIGSGALERLTRDGKLSVIYDSIDGAPLGKLNFVLPDSKGRLWLSISTRHTDVTAALNPKVHDGYIAVIDEKGIRIVADGFAFTNELRFDADEEHLLIAESMGKRVSRMRVKGASLSGRETYGPSNLGAGFPDGITFDSYGNLWCTMAMADRMIALTPEGEVLELFCDGDPAATAALERAFAASALTFEIMGAAKGTAFPWMSSITFAGKDLKTVYIGALMANSLATFRSPVAGRPMLHW